MYDFSIEELTERYNRYTHLSLVEMSGFEYNPLIIDYSDWRYHSSGTDNTGYKYDAYFLYNPNDLLTIHGLVFTALCDPTSGNILSVSISVSEDRYNADSVVVLESVATCLLASCIHNGEYTEESFQIAYDVIESCVQAALDRKGIIYNNQNILFLMASDVHFSFNAASDEYSNNNKHYLTEYPVS